MNRRNLLVIVTLALLCWGMLPSVPAIAAGPVAAGGAPGSGWVAMRVDLTGDPYSFVVETLDSSGTAQAGYAMYDSDGSHLRSLTFSAGDDDHGVRVEGENVPTVQGPTGIEVLSGGTSIKMTGSMNGPGTTLDVGVRYLVLWIASKGGSWAWNVGGAMTILGRNEGDRSIAVTSSDLDGALVAHARPLRQWGGPGAYLLATTDFSIEHVFLGYAAVPLVHANGLVVVRPGGRETTCPCAPRHALGPAAWGPGTYEVRRTGVDVVLTGGTDMHVMGVDVELPRP